jgi:hypothetical protein
VTLGRAVVSLLILEGVFNSDRLPYGDIYAVLKLQLVLIFYLMLEGGLLFNEKACLAAI